MGCRCESLPTTYLGMPLTITAPRKRDFQPLLEKFERRLQGWKAKLISRGGRIQLARSVLSALPVYYMACFRLPKWVIKRIDSIRRSFIWGRNTNGKNVISLINWGAVCTPREYGGLGIIDLDLQNISLLLRWWWRPNSQPSALWTETVIRIRVMVSQGRNRWIMGGSFFWKSLLRLLPLFNWCTVRVGGSLRWRWETGGLYSSKSTYLTVMTGGKTKWPFPEVWTSRIPQTVKVFLYLLLQGRILTRDVLQKRRINCPNECVLCAHCPLETALHLFFDCPYSKCVWMKANRTTGFALVAVKEDAVSTWSESWIQMKARGKVLYEKASIRFISICWHIWLQRNNLIFRSTLLPPEIAADRAIQVGDQWMRHC